MRVKVGREYDSKDEGDDENKTAEYVAEESEGGSNANDDEERIDYTVDPSVDMLSIIKNL